MMFLLLESEAETYLFPEGLYMLIIACLWNNKQWLMVVIIYQSLPWIMAIRSLGNSHITIR